MRQNTRLVWAGRHPDRFGGLVNTPVFRGSTVLSPTLADWTKKKQQHQDDIFGASMYGRFGTPTHHALQEAIAELEGGYRTQLYPSGLAAITSVLLSLLAAGDHVLVCDSAYSPTTQFLEGTLARYGVVMTRYNPCDSSDLASLMRPQTKVVFVESPGSDTLEIQDIPAISRVAHAHGAFVVMDNTWATPLFFKALKHGVDVSIQSATKYITGHSDSVLGVATCNEATWEQVRQTSLELGQTASPDDVFLALRGLRTLAVRLRQHWESGVALARWLEQRPEVESVLHPALPSHPGHALWKRDFTGASGLFSIALRPVVDGALDVLIDNLQLFGLGVSWGGYESLALPFEPQRSLQNWNYSGPGIRIHVGLEDVDDLIADFEQAFMHMAKVAAVSATA